MKKYYTKLILIFLFFLGFSSLICQPLYLSWQPVPNKYYVIWSKDVRNNINTSKIKIVEEGEAEHTFYKAAGVPYKGHKFIPYLWAFIETDCISEVKTDYVGKIYYDACYLKKDLIVTEFLNVSLYKAEDISILEKLADENKVKIVLEYQIPFTSCVDLTYLLSCTNESADAVEVSKLLYKTELFGMVRPDALNEIGPVSICDNIEYQKAHLYLSGYNQIDYFVPLSARSASIYISDLLGTEISKIDLEQFGSNSLVLDTNMLHSGIYFYSLFVDGVCVSTKQMIFRR